MATTTSAQVAHPRRSVTCTNRSAYLSDAVAASFSAVACRPRASVRRPLRMAWTAASTLWGWSPESRIPLTSGSSCSNRIVVLLIQAGQSPFDPSKHAPCVRSKLVFPDVEYRPSELLQRPVGLPISLPIPTDLGDPERRVGLRHGAVSRTTVPEASVYEDGEPLAPERDVWATGEIPATSGSVAQTCSTQGPTESEFWRRAGAPDTPHQSASLRGGAHRPGDQGLPRYSFWRILSR